MVEEAPPKRGLGRPPGAKNKATLLREMDSSIPQPQMFHGDCFDIMSDDERIPAGSVNLILCDPPFGCTANDWDSPKTNPYDLTKMWECYERVLTPKGVVVLFACSDSTDDPFPLRLMNSRPKGWKFYTLVFEKRNHSDGTHSEYRPQRWHEDIIVFYREGGHQFDPQMREPTGKHVAKNFGGPRIKPLHPKTILPVFPSEKSVGHPTQKPVKTMEWLVKSYSRVGDVVLDNTMGSGSTGVACANTKRAFVGIEMGDEYFHTAHDRVRSAWLNELHEELDEEPEKTLTVDDVDFSEVKVEVDPTKRPKHFKKFYEGLDLAHMDHETIKEVVVKYMNMYYLVIKGEKQVVGEAVWDVVMSTKEVKVYDVPELPYFGFSPSLEQHLYDEVTGKRYVMATKKVPAVFVSKYIFRTDGEMKKILNQFKMYNDGEVPKLIDVFDMWSSHVDARVYHGKTFNPTGKVERGVLNTFPGFEAMNSIKRNGVRKSITQFDQAKIEPMLKIAKALAGEHLDYFLDWLAYPIQTGERTDVALVSLGKPGCGKSTFFSFFMEEQIYGGPSSSRLAQTIAGGKQLAGFNKHIASTMLLVIDEPTKFSVSLQQEFKNYITGDTQEVKEKYETAVFEANITNYAFTTNSVPSRLFEADDRRFFVLQHDGTHVQDVQYLSSLRVAMKEGAEDFFLFLKNRKIKTFVLGEAPPQSSLKKHLRMSCLDPVFRYLRHLIEVDEVPTRVPERIFCGRFMLWCKDEKISRGVAKDQRDVQKTIKEKLPEITYRQAKYPLGDSSAKTTGCVEFPDKDILMNMLLDANLYQSEEEVQEDPVWENPDVEMDDADLEDIPDYEEMEEAAEPRGPHADFYDHE